MKILGIDLSTTTCGWAISENKTIIDAGFFNLTKYNTYKEKAYFIINGLLNHKFDKIVVEEALSGFSSGFTSQQTIVKLIANKSVICYIFEEEWKKPIEYHNVNTMRKKVLGAARIKGVKPKEYVKSKLPELYPDVKKFEKLNRDGNWDVHNSDMYDAVICSLFG